MTQSEEVPSNTKEQVLAQLENLQQDLDTPEQKALVVSIQASTLELMPSENIYPEQDW